MSNPVSLNTKKTILLTGATGYLGSHLTKKLLQENIFNIVVLKRSFSNTFRIQEYLDKLSTYNIDQVNLDTIFQHHQIDIILHCATDYGRRNAPILQTIEANLLLPVRLLELGKLYGVKAFINTDTILDKRINAYSLSKKQFQEWLVQSNKSLACVNVALEHFFGPGDDKTKFASFIINALLEGVDSIDLTLGEQKRDFVYIEDCVDAFIAIIKQSFFLEKDFYEFQIGTNKAIAIKEFVLLIKELTQNKKTKLLFGALPYRENEVMECKTDTEPINKLGWSANHSLVEALKKTIEQEQKIIIKI